MSTKPFCFMVSTFDDPDNWVKKMFFKEEEFSQLDDETKKGAVPLYTEVKYAGINLPSKYEQSIIDISNEGPRNYYEGWNAAIDAILTRLKKDAENRENPNPNEALRVTFEKFQGTETIHHKIMVNGKHVGWIRHNAQAAIPFGIELFGFNFRKKRDNSVECTRHDGRPRVYYHSLFEAMQTTGEFLKQVVAEHYRESLKWDSQPH